MVKSVIKIPIYRTKLVILQQKNFRDLVKKYKLTSDFKHADAMAIPDTKKNQYIVAFKEKVTYGIIAHEALHITHMIFDDRDIVLDAINDEAQCYFIQWIVDEVCKKIKIK